MSSTGPFPPTMMMTLLSHPWSEEFGASRMMLNLPHMLVDGLVETIPLKTQEIGTSKLTTREHHSVLANRRAPRDGRQLLSRTIGQLQQMISNNKESLVPHPDNKYMCNSIVAEPAMLDLRRKSLKSLERE